MVLRLHVLRRSFVLLLEVNFEVAEVPEVAGGLLALGGRVNQPVLGRTAANLAP